MTGGADLSFRYDLSFLLFQIFFLEKSMESVNKGFLFPRACDSYDNIPPDVKRNRCFGTILAQIKIFVGLAKELLKPVFSRMIFPGFLVFCKLRQCQF